MNLRQCAVAFGILFFAGAVGACDKNPLTNKLNLSSDKGQSSSQSPSGTKKLPSDLPELDQQGKNPPKKGTPKKARRQGDKRGSENPSARKPGSKIRKAGKGEAKGEQTQKVKKKGTVEVDKRGTTFSPPISIERLPDGAWYCDMGKVPWAAMVEPAGGCPFPGATLAHKSSDKDK
jgi:hypothetical protein